MVNPRVAVLQQGEARSLFIFCIGSGLTIVVPVLLMQGSLGSLVPKENIPFFSLFVGVTSSFITIALMLWSQFSSLKHDILRSNDEVYAKIFEEVTRQKVGRFRVFDNVTDALRYEYHLIENAKVIWNTRFVDTGQYDITGARRTMTETQDDLIAKAVATKSCHYEFITANNQEKEINIFGERLKKHAENSSLAGFGGSGEYSAWSLNVNNDFPIMQLFIVELRDGFREAMVGWIHSDKRIMRPSVVLFQDPGVVGFYLGMFEAYKDAAVSYRGPKFANATPEDKVDA